MKLKFILPAVLLLLIVLLFFYPVYQQESIDINRPMADVYNQLHEPENWIKWETHLKDKGNIRQVIQKDGFSFATSSGAVQVKFLTSFIFGINDGGAIYDVVLLPQRYDRSTTVIIGFRKSLLFKIIPAFKRQLLKKTIVVELKNYLEHPSSYYGVNFKILSTTGMDMMVCQTVIDSVNRFTEIKKSAEKLLSLVPSAELENKDKIFLQITPSNKNLDMFVGVALKRQLPSNQGLTYMHIPAQKILVVSFNGLYANRRSLYTAAGRYIHDHSLRSAMPPIEIYDINGLPLSDTSRVDAQILFSAY